MNQLQLPYQTRIVSLIVCLTLALFSGSGNAQNNDLTRQDSIELGLIVVEEGDDGNDLTLFVDDLIKENETLAKELQEAEENKGHSSNTLFLVIVLFSVLITTLLILTYIRFRRQRLAIQKYMEIADKAKNTLEQREKFLAYTNHEIRTPLNAVSGSAELLGGTDLSEDQKKYVRTIKASVDNVLILVNDVLDLSRIESGNIEFVNQDFLLTDVVQGVAYILNEKVEKKGIQLITEVEESIPPVLKGDSRYLNQILINLCNNAVKFTDLGKVTIKASLKNAGDKKVWIRFDIIDTGKGIRKSKLPTIFNQFEQETRHTIKTKGGSGLGLAITKQLVEAQGGSISVKSKYLEGTTFSVELPFERSKGVASMSKNANPDVLKDLRVMIIDDNELNREILGDLLLSLNSSCVVSRHVGGETCIEELSKNDYDVLLMDIQMPGMDGYETSQYIRKNMRAPMNEVPIIAMTAYAMEDVAENCFESGMNDFITKPVDSNFLLTKIERLSEKKSKNKLPELVFEHTDLGNLKRLTAGDNTRMLKYIDLFISNVPDLISDLEEHTQSGNLNEAVTVLHKLKGNATYMGNIEVGELYDELELTEDILDADKKEKLEQAARLMHGCLSEIRKVRQNYKMLFLGIK